MRTIGSALAACAAVLWLGAAGAQANHFKMELEIAGSGAKAQGKEMQNGGTDLPQRGTEARPVLRVKAGERLQAHWQVTSTGKDKVENVLVHFYVAPEDEVGQRKQPNLDKEHVLVESAVTMDFEPKDTTSADMPFQCFVPGTYRVQIETRGAAGKELHEHVAVLDLVVEKDPAKKDDESGK